VALDRQSLISNSLSILAKSVRSHTLIKMRSVELLENIRPILNARLGIRLISDEKIRQNILEKVNLFYNILIMAVGENDPSCLDSQLLEWVGNRSQNDLNHQDNILATIINKVLSLIFEISQEVFEPEESIDLINNLLPFFIYINDLIYRNETGFMIGDVPSGEELDTEIYEKISKSKTEYISVAAHELKTPLTLLKGYLTMLRELLSPSEVYAQAEIFMDGIEVGYMRLGEIVDDLIDVSLIDNNVLPIVNQPVWIHQLLESIELEIADIVKKRNLTLSIDAFPGSKEMILGDGERLIQAFRNLILNAIKYTPDGGRIMVSGRTLPGFIEVIFKDTGIGIDPKDHLRVFDKFSRLENPLLHSSSKTKFKGGGPGLGLSITKGIIEAHGGAIWVESDGYNENTCPGSTFHVLLPMRTSLSEDSMTKLSRLLNKER
jgi:signal transduction histidine kinase